MTDFLSPVPPRIQKSRNQKRQTWKVSIGWPKREQQNASSSSGNESHNPNAQASGDRLQSKLKEDGDVMKYVVYGRQAYSELSDEGARKPPGTSSEHEI